MAYPSSGLWPSSGLYPSDATHPIVTGAVEASGTATGTHATGAATTTEGN